MEPLTIIAISAAVGGAAGKLTAKAWDLGERWLSTYFQDHHPKAVEKAKENSLAFLADLAQRVSQLENAASNSEHIKEHIISALEDPDFSALLKDALLASSRTENNNTHKVLARLVSERLCCETDDMVKLTIPLACESAKSLTTTQLRFLTIAAVIEVLLSSKVSVANHQAKIKFAVEWLQKKLPLVLPEEKITQASLVHMECVSCIHLTRLAVCPSTLTMIFRRQMDTDSTKGLDTFLSTTEIGQRFTSYWKDQLDHIRLTTVGTLIGICVFDELTGEQTDVKLYVN